LKFISIFLLLFSLLNGASYQVKLFDTNRSKGIWQMVGTLGLEDFSVEAVDEEQQFDEDSFLPEIPDEDGGEVVDENLSEDEDPAFIESGFSEESIAIAKVFDTNFADSQFNSLDERIGELAMYSYNPDLGDKWLYYNSHNSDEANDFDSLEKGKAYWAKYDDYSVKTDERSSNSGFLFSDNFSLGTASYSDKLSEGWNLISLPEKRSVERVSLIFYEHSKLRDYNLSISKKDSSTKLWVEIESNSSTEDAVKEINSALDGFGIFAVKSENNISLLSREQFTLSDKNLTYYSFPERDSSLLEINSSVESRYFYGAVLDLNISFLAMFDTVEMVLNGEDINLSSFSSQQIGNKDSIFWFKIESEDKKLISLFSEEPFYMEQKGYIKRYEYNGSNAPDGFLSIDGNRTIFKLVSKREDIDSSFQLIQKSSAYETVRGFEEVVEFVENLSVAESGSIQFPQLSQAPRYMEVYTFPKSNSLKAFLNGVLEGHIPTQVISLKSGSSLTVKWDSMPISKDIGDWIGYNSSYDTLFAIDKRRGYWIKFVEGESATDTFSIDSENRSISKNVTHMVIDNLTTNIFHYDIAIYLKNVSKETRAYLKLGELLFDLERGEDSFFGEFDYEDLYSVDMESISSVEVSVVDENGVKKSTTFDTNFSKPERPSSSLLLEEIEADQHLRIYGDLTTFSEVDTALCRDFGKYDLFVVRADGNRSIPKERVLLSDPVKRSFVALYKGTSQLISSSSETVKIAEKYNTQCEKESNESSEYEGVRLGASAEDISLFYKKESAFFDSTLPKAPEVMYFYLNGNIVRLEFDSVYNGKSFFILDSDGRVFSGLFERETYDNDSFPMEPTEIE
jgi:hypothetical protein